MKLLVAVVLILITAYVVIGQDKAGAAGNYPSLPAEILNAQFTDIEGHKFTLADYAGKPVLVHIWATWSGPDRAEFPRLVALQKKYASQGFVVIGVEAGDVNGKPSTFKTVRAVKEKYSINYTLAQAKDTAWFLKLVNNLSKFNGVPQSFLIDRESRIRGVFLGGGPAVNKHRNETVEALIIEKVPANR